MQEEFSLTNSTCGFDATVLGLVDVWGWRNTAPATPSIWDIVTSEPAETVENSNVEEFISSFRRANEQLPSAIRTLDTMLRDFPALCFVVFNTNSDGPEVHFHRKSMIDQMGKSFNFTSFERGLKHAGLYVKASTHGKVVKIWSVVDGKKMPKKTCKRSRSNDDEDSFRLN